MNRLLAPGLRAALLFALAGGSVQAATLDEAVIGDFSNDRLAPTLWRLDGSGLAANGETGHNVIAGRTGRADTVDRDYVHLVVPEGYVWSELRIGQQTTTGGSGGSFLGVAIGDTMPLEPTATSAEGLYLWTHYALSDRGTNVLGAMKLNGVLAGGYQDGEIGAGSYTLWIQELAVGSFAYRFNIVLSPVPEAPVWLLLVTGAVVLRTCVGRRTRLA